jgi:hypothetical protein
MDNDSITEEIRAIRQSLAAKFNNDISLIMADVRRQQHESGRVFVRLPKRDPRVVAVAKDNERH